MTITIRPYKPTARAVDTVAGLVLAVLLREVQRVDDAMSEGRRTDNPVREWPETDLTTACAFAIRNVSAALGAMVGKRYADVVDLHSELYHACEPLRLVQAVAPASAVYVRRLIDGAMQSYGELAPLLEEAGIEAPADRQPSAGAAGE